MSLQHTMAVINICDNGHHTEYPGLNDEKRVERINHTGLDLWRCPKCSAGFKKAVVVFNR